MGDNAIDFIIRNNTAQRQTVNVFDASKPLTGVDYANGFLDSANGVNAQRYDLITNWVKTLYAQLYFKQISGIVYGYTTDADRQANTTAVCYFGANATPPASNTTFTLNVTIAVPATVYFYLRAFANENITVDWGDGNIATYPVATSSTIVSHAYSVANTYTLIFTFLPQNTREFVTNSLKINAIAIVNVAILEQITLLGCTIATFNATLQSAPSVIALDLRNNAITDTNAILQTLDNAGQINGVAQLNGGTNAAPSGAGITAKSNLIDKGWTVTTN